MNKLDYALYLIEMLANIMLDEKIDKKEILFIIETARDLRK